MLWLTAIGLLLVMLGLFYGSVHVKDLGLAGVLIILALFSFVAMCFALMSAAGAFR